MLVVTAGGAVFLVRTFFPSHIVLLPVLLVGGMLVGIGALLLLGGVSICIVSTLIRPQRGPAPYPDPERALDLPVERLSFPSLKGGHLVHGFYIPRQDSTTAVVLSPGYRRGLKDMWSSPRKVPARSIRLRGAPLFSLLATAVCSSSQSPGSPSAPVRRRNFLLR